MAMTPTQIQRPWAIFALVWIVVAVAGMAFGGHVAEREARQSALAQARTAGILHAAVLRSELERHRSLPMVLAQDPELAAALTSPSQDRSRRLDEKFERLATQVRAAVIYLLNDDGVTLAASNWRLPESFVGSDYGFRPYFTQAMEEGQGALFALGTVSGRPGLYLSRRIEGPNGAPLGVIVAKVEFDALEADWRASGEPALVTDADGVVLITTVPEWRFKTTRPLTPERLEALKVEQTAGASAESLPFAIDGPAILDLARGAPPDSYARSDERVPGTDWTLHLLSPSRAQLDRAKTLGQVLALLIIALMAGGAGVVMRRRQRRLAEAAEEHAARQVLEKAIDERTLELRQTNDRLRDETDQRQRLQDDLVQANKLATLGQIAAGVAHEINQPIAAIRTHADSASVYLERADGPAAGRSLAEIGRLTERVGSITDELRAFSRKSRSEAAPVLIDEAIDGALLLMSARLKQQGVRIDRKPAPKGATVLAERNRVEQVLVNLLQNAAEALQSTRDPRVSIVVEMHKADVSVTIGDNGPGVAPEVLERLFTPFTTDKSAGMGLGLVISRDIAAGFGGELNHERTSAGAAFRLTLPRAA